MRILITGASGFIGQHLLRVCLRQGHEVVACVRDVGLFAQGVDRLSVVRCDFARDQRVDDWLPRLQQVDVVINAVGIISQSAGQGFDDLHRDAPIALFAACEQVGVKHVIQISALGADDEAVSHYHRSKKQADDFLAHRQVRWTILMPSIVYGPGAKSMALFNAMAALPVIGLVDQGEQRIQPIHVDDLCRAVMQIIDSGGYDKQRIAMVGAQAISMKQLFVSLRQRLGLRPALLLSMPFTVSLRLAQLGGLVGNSPINGDAVRMLQRGNTADVQLFIDTFGFRPRGFIDSVAQRTVLASDQWYAGLYFIKPVLRISLGLMWIITAVVSAFIYPQAQSYAMLAQLGITDHLAPITLYSAAAINFILGIATLSNYRIRTVGLIQIALILIYTLLISVYLPHLWSHPFGPVLKNIPLVVATWAMIVIYGVRSPISHGCQLSNAHGDV